MIKKILKSILSPRIFNYMKNLKILVSLNKAYIYDLRRYYKYSEIKGSDTSTKLIGRIIKEYHVMEKGLTMPQTRLGFGKELMLTLCNDCNDYILKYGTEDEQLLHAVGVIAEYEKYHSNKNFVLDGVISNAIENIKTKLKEIKITAQKKISKQEFFKNTESSFLQFSNSRSSVRSFTDEEIPIEKINDSLNLVRNTPSVCNRQGWRTYVFTNKEKINEILEIQGGSRGFGHLTNKLIVITEELGVLSGVYERNQAFVDGGIYAMNVLYALHYYKIGSCILNCSKTPEKDLLLRNSCKIKDSEVFIAMIACGIPPETFMTAVSKRYDLNKTNVIIY